MQLTECEYLAKAAEMDRKAAMTVDHDKRVDYLQISECFRFLANAAKFRSARIQDLPMNPAAKPAEALADDSLRRDPAVGRGHSGASSGIASNR
jgi:hypothetical protein